MYSISTPGKQYHRIESLFFIYCIVPNRKTECWLKNSSAAQQNSSIIISYPLQIFCIVCQLETLKCVIRSAVEQNNHSLSFFHFLHHCIPTHATCTRIQTEGITIKQNHLVLVFSFLASSCPNSWYHFPSICRRQKCILLLSSNVHFLHSHVCPTHAVVRNRVWKWKCRRQ